MKKQDSRSLPQTAQEAIRILAVKAVLNGTKRSKAAELYNVSRQAIYNWMADFEKGGKAALKAKKRGRKGQMRLKPLQAALTVRLIKNRLPDQLTLPFALWTREAVAQLIERQFKVTVSNTTVGRYLKRWGFTPQKPAKRAIEQKPEAVRQWLQVQYPAIHKQAVTEKAAIYWGDETGVRSQDQVGRSYSRKGKTPVIPCTGQRFGYNMISAITNRGALKFMIYKESFTSVVYLEFLERLVDSSAQKVFLIVDNHSVHTSKEVKKWLSECTDKISVFYLPSYSPELNPDERLNNDVKSNAVGRKRAKNADELFANLWDHMQYRQRQPEVIRKFFNDKHVQYAAFPLEE